MDNDITALILTIFGQELSRVSHKHEISNDKVKFFK